MIADIDRMKAAERVVAAHMAQPFIWGVRDCATVAASMVRELTGSQPVQEWPNYTTARGAMRAVKRLGHDNLVDAVTAHLTPIEGGIDRRIGDIVGIQSVEEGVPSLAVFLGFNAIMVPVLGMFRRADLTYWDGRWWGVR